MPSFLNEPSAGPSSYEPPGSNSSGLPPIRVDGAGRAGLACAARLARAGYRVQVVESRAGGYDAFEAFDTSFVELLRSAGVCDPLTACDARTVRGFNGETYVVARRDDVSGALRAAARAAGVAFARPEEAWPDARWLVDATGRTARHTRVGRTDPAVAYLFEAPPTGELVFRQDAFGWGYRIGDARGSTIGVVVAKPYPDVGAARAWANETFGVAFSAGARALRRAASAQRSVAAIAPGRIAVGDAALAHDPRAGAGQRFAVASALLAAATIRTCVEAGERAAIAQAFYADAVARSARRAPQEVQNDPSPRADLSLTYAFCGRVTRGGVLRDELIAEDDVVEWNGTRARWSAGVDLLWLVESAAVPAAGWHLVDRLVRRGVGRSRANAVVASAIARGLLRPAATGYSG